MVGIHALSIAKFVSFAPCPTEPNWARSANAALLRSGPNDPKRARSANRLLRGHKANRNGALPIRPDRGAFSMQRTTSREWKRSCAQRFATSLAFGSVFERLGCPHKVADTRLALTTDR
jgi:hypothetical protein